MTQEGDSTLLEDSQHQVIRAEAKWSQYSVEKKKREGTVG